MQARARTIHVTAALAALAHGVQHAARQFQRAAKGVHIALRVAHVPFFTLTLIVILRQWMQAIGGCGRVLASRCEVVTG